MVNISTHFLCVYTYYIFSEPFENKLLICLPPWRALWRQLSLLCILWEHWGPPRTTDCLLLSSTQGWFPLSFSMGPWSMYTSELSWLCPQLDPKTHAPSRTLALSSTWNPERVLDRALQGQIERGFLYVSTYFVARGRGGGFRIPQLVIQTCSWTVVSTSSSLFAKTVTNAANPFLWPLAQIKFP